VESSLLNLALERIDDRDDKLKNKFWVVAVFDSLRHRKDFDRFCFIARVLNVIGIEGPDFCAQVRSRGSDVSQTGLTCDRRVSMSMYTCEIHAREMHAREMYAYKYISFCDVTRIINLIISYY
jgi:hypothetical protein